jgi:sulfur-carrier protein adenylyltransferase/sulfurtransferase
MWFLEQAPRFLQERIDISGLEQRADWLRDVAWRVADGLRFEVDFEVEHGAEVFKLTLVYPELFPRTPPSVLVREGGRVSTHQWGAGGELCLEYRPDNWEERVTGAMMMESAHRLIAEERPNAGVGVVPSAHNISLGQKVRGDTYRFLMRAPLREYLTTQPGGTALRTHISERRVRESKDRNSYVAVVNGVSMPGDEGPWLDSGVPFPDWSHSGWVVIVDDVASVPAFPDCVALKSWLESAGFVQVSEALTSDKAFAAILIMGKSNARFAWVYPTPEPGTVINYTVIDEERFRARLPAAHQGLRDRSVGIIGCGSLGSKIAISLARAGVGRLHLVDDDIMMPGNLVRNDLDWQAVGHHKSAALRRRSKEIAPECLVTAQQVGLGTQEASGTVSALLDRLGKFDLIIDATANAVAFNYCASTAQANAKPMLWAEVFAGGIGGYIARARPSLEPPPAAARRQILAWCEAQGVAWTGVARDYGVAEADQPALVADDADVSVIAAHATRMALDTLADPADSQLPFPVYMIGLSNKWLFTQPFDTKPITLVVEPWTNAAEIDVEAMKEVVKVVSSLLPNSEGPDAADTAA